MKCKVCETEFEPLNENRYTVKDTNILTHEESHCLHLLSSSR